MRTAPWPEDWSELTAWDKFPLDKPTARKLPQWCDRFLDAAQWKQLHAVIRAARRDMSQYRTVRLSRSAHDTLHRLAQREQITLSAVIERYLSEGANVPVAASTGHTATTAPQPSVAAKDTWAISTPAVVGGPIRRDVSATPPSHVLKVSLSLAVENNSKFVRGKKKAREEIE